MDALTDNALRFLQLALLVATFYTLATGTLAIHRPTLAVFTAVALVFSVFGVNAGIYGTLVDASASKALGVGWLFLSFINVGR
jgi:SHO1 osmosensor